MHQNGKSQDNSVQIATMSQNGQFPALTGFPPMGKIQVTNRWQLLVETIWDNMIQYETLRWTQNRRLICCSGLLLLRLDVSSQG